MGSSASVGQSERASFNSVEIQASNRGSFDLPFGASLRDLPATVPEAAAAAGLGFGASTPVSPGALRRGLAVTHSDRGSPWDDDAGAPGAALGRFHKVPVRRQ